MAQENSRQGAGFGLDEGDPFGARVARRLREEVVVWLTTVAPSGAPSPNPVWFLWDGGGEVLVYNLESAARVRHVADNPRVTLNFDGDGRGGDIVVISGEARVDRELAACDASPRYLEKYTAQIARIGMTPESFAARYGVPIRIRLARLRGH